MRMDIPIGKEGHVQGGKYDGWTVLVEDDTSGSTGGYYLLLSLKTDPTTGFDHWVEDRSFLPGLFEGFGCDRVEWT